MFGRPIHLITIFGFRIRLDWSWFIIAFVLTWSLAVGVFPRMPETEGLSQAAYWIMGAAGTVGLFVCVALHELVGRFMTDQPPVVRADMPVDQFVTEHVYRHNARWFPAIENGNHIVGWVDAGAVKHLPRDEWNLHTVREITHTCDDDDVIQSNEDAMAALKRMSQEKKPRLCVVDNGELLGVITFDQLTKRLALQLEMEGESAAPAQSVQASTNMQDEKT